MNFFDLYAIFDEIDNEPYPKIENIKQDYKVGKNLYNLYAGSKGELTSVIQYTYQSLTNENDLKKIFQGISIDEMKHLKIIGELLIALGFIPFYMNSNKIKWCSDNINYKHTTINKMLEYNIENKQIIIKEYKKIIELAESKNIENIINRIIKDEENHIRILKTILNNNLK